VSTLPYPERDGVFEIPVRVLLFGFDATNARAYIRPRARSWRIAGAVRTGLLFLVIAPVVGVLPPHAPWILGALGAGGFLAKRRWAHRFTLEALEAACPKCGAALTVAVAQLRTPHTLHCEGCHHEATLEVATGALEPLRALTG